VTAWRTRAAALIAIAAGSVAALWVLWGPVIADRAGGGALRLCTKNFYAPDQYAVLGIARLAQDGMSVYHEPYTATGTSVYPSEYYRLLGMTADATGTTVIWAWNVVGFVVSLALIALSVAFARRLAPGTRAWVLAPAPFLLGTLYWWGTGGWLYAWNRGIIWPPVASLYSPGAEGPAVFTAGVALLLLVVAIGRGRSRRTSLLLGAGGGIAAGLTLHLHANVVVFCVLAVALMMLWDVLLVATRRRRTLIAAGALALVVASVLTPSGGVAVRTTVLLAGIAAVALTDARWRRECGPAVAAWAAGAVFASLPLSARLASETLAGNGYFYERQDSVAAAALDLPVVSVLGLMAPLWVLAAAAVVRLTRDPERVVPGWTALVAGLASATLLLTFAGRLGTEGLEWHRFLIYGGVLTSMAAFPALWLMFTESAGRAGRSAAIGVAALLAATLPTTFAFAADQRGAVTCTPPQEAEAFQEIGRLARDRVVLLDQCFPPGPIRVLSGARIVHYNAGIALPGDRDGMDGALANITAGELPDPALLQRAGATAFLTNNFCGGVAPEEIASRLGRPYARVTLRDSEVLGFPAPLIYALYAIPALR
jgi:hypothetical protein